MGGGYDAWRLRAPEGDELPPTPCPVCTGDESAEPCCERCELLVLRVRTRQAARRLYEHARRALAMARAYRAEGGPHDLRAAACVERVLRVREQIRLARRVA